jgi:hypothetical protein
MVLKGADCVVFVADSQEAMLDADLDSLANLKENLEVNEIDPDEIPMVLQYNKRDLPNALPVDVLNKRLNPRNLPFFEAVAKTGAGVEETLKGATTLVFKSLAGKYGGGEPVPARPAAAAPSAAGPSTAPVPAAARPAAPAPRPAAPPAPPPPPRPAPAPDPPALSLEEPPSLDAILEDDLGAPAPAASRASSTDDLLDSLDLGDGGGAPPPALSLEGEDHMEELEVLPEDLEDPAPVGARPGGSTLARAPDEGEDLRRRIGRPQPAAALALEDEGEEISFEGPVSTPAPRPAPAPARAPAPAAAPPPAAVSEAPVSIPVEVTAAPGQREVTVPIEVTIGRQGAEVHLKLNIALKIRIAG